MSCNSCAKSFSLLRKEKGCPNCGFSYCSKCLNWKLFIPKLNTEAKVCSKCNQLATKPAPTGVEPPDAYYRRLNMTDKDQITKQVSCEEDPSIAEISLKLKLLKEDRLKQEQTGTSEDDIKNRLKSLKGDTCSTTDQDLHARLAKLKGCPVDVITKKPVLPPPDTRTEQEQADDLMKQYLEQTSIDTKYNDEFDGLINDMEMRMQKLKGGITSGTSTDKEQHPVVSEDEEETVRNIVEKVKAEALLDDDISPSTNDELPFCEICNEDAHMRCLGCKYLFCKRCWAEHKDDDDGCDRYEPYKAPKSQ